MLTVPVTITIDGPPTAPIVLALDSGGQVELTAEQAHAIADDLASMADEAADTRAEGQR